LAVSEQELQRALEWSTWHVLVGIASGGVAAFFQWMHEHDVMWVWGISIFDVSCTSPEWDRELTAVLVSAVVVIPLLSGLAAALLEIRGDPTRDRRARAFLRAWALTELAAIAVFLFVSEIAGLRFGPVTWWRGI
jgi:hypothetical protein